MAYTEREIALFESSYVSGEAQLKEFFQLALQDLDKTYQQTIRYGSIQYAYDAVLERMCRMRSYFLAKEVRNMDPDFRAVISSAVSKFEETLNRILQDIDWRIQDMVNRGARLPHQQGHFKVDAPTYWETPVEQPTQQFTLRRPNQDAWQGYAARPVPDESSSANKQADEPVVDPSERIRRIRERERIDIEESRKEMQKFEKEHREKMAKLRADGIDQRARASRRKF